MITNTGGPAFPANHYDLADGEHGMTLRDYFAAKALQGYLSHVPYDKVIDPSLVANSVYLFADAMMKAREE